MKLKSEDGKLKKKHKWKIEYKKEENVFGHWSYLARWVCRRCGSKSNWEWGTPDKPKTKKPCGLLALENVLNE